VQKGFTPILIVILLAIGIVGGYFVYTSLRGVPPKAGDMAISPTSSSIPAPTTQPESTSSADMKDWKTYANKVYKFRYPRDWQPTQDRQDDIIKSADNSYSFSIRQLDKSNSGAEICGGGPGPQPTSLKNVQVGEVSTKLDLVHLAMDSEALIQSHPIHNNNNSYCIFFHYKSVDENTDQKSIKILDQILSTFRFIK